MATSNHILDSEQTKQIRHALLIGLASYAEIERLTNAQALYKLGGNQVPNDLCVIHPTGAGDTVSEFAAALRDLEYS